MSNDSGPAPDTDISGVPVPAPSATAWFHCFAGIAGDMALGSLVDERCADLAGLQEDRVEPDLHALRDQLGVVEDLLDLVGARRDVGIERQ